MRSLNNWGQQYGGRNVAINTHVCDNRQTNDKFELPFLTMVANTFHDIK